MNVIQTILDYNKSKESGGKTDITKSDIISALGYTPISELEKGANSGIAELDNNGKVLTSELPSYVDDVEEFNNLVELKKHTGEASKIYITLDDNKCYRWGGTAYVEISSSITLGETSGTAFRGDLGKEAYDKSHTHSNKEVIDSITSEDITNWNNKSDFDGKYTSLTDTPTIPTVTNDLTNELKANYDLASTQTHTHSNKELLDKLSLNKDNKLLYNGDKVDSDVDLTAIIDDSTITDKTTWSSNKINTTIPKTWVGTKADYEQIKDTLENGTIVYITDDESVILLDKTEITKMKLTDEEFKRQINTLYDINNGSTLSIETDSSTAYAKTIPTGGRLMSVKNIGGRSIVWNQLVDSNIDIIDTTRYSFNGQHLKTNVTDNLSLSDDICTLPTIPVGHKVLIKIKFIKGNVGNKEVTIGGYHNTANISWQCRIDLPKNTELAGKTLCTLDTTTDTAESIKLFLYKDTIPLLTNLDCYINYYDLTTMFGSGNEPASVEEFEAMFPADYYPYNAGEIISADTESVVVQGKNVWNLNGYTADDLIDLKTGYWGVKLRVKPNSTYCLSVARDTALSGMYGKLIGANGREIKFFGHKTISDINAYTGHPITFQTANENYVYVAINSFTGFDTWKSDFLKYFPSFQIELGNTPTAYTPYHQTGYPIPEAIRALTGYGWSAGNAKNYVDYENKKYYQCVQSVDLGTLTWSIGDRVSFETFQLKGQKLTRNYDIAPNILCSKYLTKAQNQLWGKTNVTGITTNANVDGCVHLNDTTYTDVATFTQAMSGVILYYELAEPIVTDISSLIPDDFLRNIEVEALGSITFKNSNGDYHISVPSELSYTVKFNSNASKEYVDSELAKKANNTDITNTLSSYAKKTDIPTKLPANGGNADTVNNHTVLSDVPTDAKFTDTITSIEDSSTTSTTSTWSAQKINDTITNSKNARVILSMGRDIVEAETKTAELVSLDGAYLYWSSQAGTNNYVFGIILYVYNKWTMIPIAQSSEDASTGISFSITDNTITMTKHNTGSTPTAGGVFALGPTLI